MVQVEIDGYDDCDISRGKVLAVQGNTSATLTKTGRFYYIIYISYHNDCIDGDEGPY